MPASIVIKQRRSKGSKHGNRWTPRTINGKVVKFQSAAEARRWDELALMEKAGVIRTLSRQVVFDLSVSGVKITTYRADFTYFERDRVPYGDWSLVVEDVKGYPNEVYPIKKLLMLACHGIAIREITPRGGRK